MRSAAFTYILLTLAVRSVGGAFDVSDRAQVRQFLEEESDDFLDFLRATPSAWIDLVGSSSSADLDLGRIPHARHLEEYVKPVWFDMYKQLYGRRPKRCKWLKQIRPENGTTCRTNMRLAEDYTCMFGPGAQECPDGTYNPNYKCDCSLETKQWSCDYFDPCHYDTDEETIFTECPKDHPLSYSKTPMCKGEGMECPYSTETCCGKTYPKVECTCGFDGIFTCRNHDHCLDKKCGLRGKEEQDLMFENDNADMVIDDDLGLEDDDRAES